MDVKNFFLHIEFIKVIYMDPLQGLFAWFVGMCKLKHSLYDLNQAPKV